MNDGGIYAALGVRRIINAYGTNTRLSGGIMAPEVTAAILRLGLKIVHMTGEKDRDNVEAAYQENRLDAQVVTYLDRMAEEYARADLVISRAGATTLAEIMVHRRAAILIPYPHAPDRHQHHNAMALVHHRAAEMIDPQQLTGRVLAERILHFYHHPDDLHAMGERAGTLARPEAAQKIVEHCYKMLTKNI